MTQIPEFLTEKYATKKRKRIVRNTALSWANSMEHYRKRI